MIRFCLACFLVAHSIFLCAQTDTTATSEPGCHQADKWYSQYQFDKALTAYTKCCVNLREPFNCWKKMAQCEVQLGLFGEAKGTYLKILSRDTTHTFARNQLAKLLEKSGNLPAARDEYYRLLETDPKNVYYHKQVADLSLKSGDVMTALGYYQAAHNLNPKDIMVITEMARLYQGMKHFDVADTLIALGRSIDSSYVPLLLEGVKSAYRQQQYAQVITTVDQVLRTTRDSSAYLLKLFGVSSFHTGDHDRAIKLLKKLVANGQESEVVFYYLGLALRESGESAASAAAFQSAIEAGTSINLPNYYTDLAVAFEEMGNHQSAIRAYQAAYQASGSEIILYHLARNYDAYYKDKETALRYYERFLAANDSNNNVYTDYTEHRINELKEVMHFAIDTLE